MISTSGGMLTQEKSSQCASDESALIAQFRARLLGANHSSHQKCPWVTVISIYNSQVLLAVYDTLKAEGELKEWSRELYDERQDIGICVFALLP